MSRLTALRPAVSRPLTALLAVTVLVAVTFMLPPPPARAAATPAAAPQLDWLPCDFAAGHDCATLAVPLDHDEPAGATIELAVIRKPATDQANRIGSLFMNPGGPGGSGINALIGVGQLFPAAVAERFDLVSWDPRGVGRSTAVQCFDTPDDEESFLASRSGDVRGFPVTAQQADTWIAATTAFGQQCADRVGDLLSHVGTVATARDLDMLRQAVGDDALNYWGLSYGTYLGAVYASLFPQRLRAIVLDANVNPVAWNDADSPLGTFLRVGSDIGSAVTLQGFLATCGTSAPGECAFSAGDAGATRAKYDELLARAAVQPVTLPDGSELTAAEIVSATVNPLYQAIPVAGILRGWVPLADFLEALWQATEPLAGPGAATVVAQSLAALAPEPTTYAGIEQQLAILCSDSPNPPASQFAGMVPGAVARSGPMGAHWTWVTVTCPNWPARADATYTGPWQMDRSVTPLLLNTTADPATPYESALATAAALDGRLVTVEGYGHGVLVNPSTCANAIAAAYLIDGTLPPAGVVCAQDTPPFTPAPTPGPGPTPGPTPVPAAAVVPRFTG